LAGLYAHGKASSSALADLEIEKESVLILFSSKKEKGNR